MHVAAALFVVAMHEISKPPIVIGISIIGIQLDCLVKVFDSQLIILQIVVIISPAVVCFDEIRLKTNGCAKIINSLLILANVAVNISTIIIG